MRADNVGGLFSAAEALMAFRDGEDSEQAFRGALLIAGFIKAWL